MTLKAGFHRLSDQLLMFWKRCLSFRKPGWEFSDYPTVIRAQKIDPKFPASRFTQNLYAARILGWHISAGGDTKKDAKTALEAEFAASRLSHAERGEALPRPGVQVPIKFGSQERIKSHEELADDFIQRVLGLPWAWVSDGSSLWDFHSEETNDALYLKIKEVYDVDVSDIESANLPEILDRIATAQRARQGKTLKFA